LPERGLVTLLILLGVLVVSLMGLEPRQSATALGVEILIAGLVITAAVMALTLSARPRPGEESHLASALVIAAIGSVPSIGAGVSLIAGVGGGLDWVLASFTAAIIAAMLNAWILLVEILR
jgi:modulator of FtsH protease